MDVAAQIKKLGLMTAVIAERVKKTGNM